MDIDLIKEKLKQYQSIYGFPLKGHQYDWSPDPISLNQIQQIEEYYEIDLPYEYKLFLSTIGNGGLGPTYYPLYALNKSIQTFNLSSFKSQFPLDKLWLRCGTKESFYKNWDLEDFNDKDLPLYEDCLDDCKNDLIWAGILKEDDSVEEYIYDLQDNYEETDGTLRIGHSGCGLDFHLVLNGKHRGEVWHNRRGGMVPHSANFFSFIEEWLGSILEKANDKTLDYYISNNKLNEAQLALDKLKDTADIAYTNNKLILLEALIVAKEKKELPRVQQLEKLLQETNPISRAINLLSSSRNHFYESVYDSLEEFTHSEFQEKKGELLKSGVFDWEFNYALNQAKKMLSILPQCDIITVEISIFYYGLGDFEKFQEWDKKVKENTLFSENVRGCYALYMTKDYKKASKLFKKALSIKEDWLPALSNLGLAYAYLARYTDAEELFHKLIQEHPDYEWSYVGLAENYLLQGKISEAIDLLKIAISEKAYDVWRVVKDPIWMKCYNHPKYQELMEEEF
ncbi:tetratricopeptide repeat protein [Flagellimonas sp. S174]|uniref:tetratricopeptide repeat protein n=1 Tax=Flagellimonas sp. S174 TaxID=3410790 RepID=UPI003BF5F212